MLRGEFYEFFSKIKFLLKFNSNSIQIQFKKKLAGNLIKMVFLNYSKYFFDEKKIICQLRKKIETCVINKSSHNQKS